MPGCLSKKRQLRDKKYNPGDLPGWKEALSIPLLCTHSAPKEQVDFSPYEMLCERPFVYVSDLFLDPEAQTLWSYTMATGQFQQDMCLWDVNWTQKILKSHHYMFQALKS